LIVPLPAKLEAAEPGEWEIGGAGCKRFCHHATALIGRHCTVDALGLEVARGRGEKQRAVIVQTLYADETRSCAPDRQGWR